jgi:hypothetical protein
MRHGNRYAHDAVLYAANLIAHYGENFRAAELRDRLRCSNCRGR